MLDGADIPAEAERELPLGQLDEHLRRRPLAEPLGDPPPLEARGRLDHSSAFAPGEDQAAPPPGAPPALAPVRDDHLVCRPLHLPNVDDPAPGGARLDPAG